MTAPVGVLLVNLGTPDAPEPEAVRRYLAEFLADPRVLDISTPGRWLLLNLVILPRRPQASAAAYSKIWTAQGSPLLVHSRALTDAVASRLRDAYRVELAMRYGAPSIPAGLAALHAAGCDRIVAMPLYPQYASASTGSSVEAIYRHAAAQWNTPFVTVVPPFWHDARFVAAFAGVARPAIDELDADHVLMSFHGLPERHMRKSDESGRHCLQSASCCDAMVDANRNCYRAQCFATARALAQALALAPDRTSVSFQSRLGRDPWIKPWTDEVLPQLVRAGKKRVAVMCPAFVADCLETLEEIGIRAEQSFRDAGGQALRLVPSLNAEPAWADTVTAMVREAT